MTTDKAAAPVGAVPPDPIAKIISGHAAETLRHTERLAFEPYAGAVAQDIAAALEWLTWIVGDKPEVLAIKAHIAALASQAARMGELEQDAARYAVLRDVGPPDASGYPTLLQWTLVTQERGSGRLLFGSELDAAIDKLRGEAG